MTTTLLSPEAVRQPESGAAVVLQRFARGHLSVTLYNADCLTLAKIEADAVIADPQYGMNWDTDSTRFSGGQSRALQMKKRGVGRSDYGAIEGDDKPFEPAPWLEYPIVVMWGANHYAQRLPVGTTLVWLKKHPELYGSFLSDAEVGWMKGGHGVYCYYKPFPPPVRALESGGDPCMPIGTHPTQKPIGLMAWCMELAKVPDGATVCDPYMGSGTTGIACLRTGRNFIGVEKDPKHFKTACARLEREINQGALL